MKELTGKKATMELTLTDIEAGYADDRWLGYGYLEGRSRIPHHNYFGDNTALKHANLMGWSYENLFRWMNSREGRYFADFYIGSPSEDTIENGYRLAMRWGLLDLPECECDLDEDRLCECGGIVITD
jgi:hypothetical protein